MDSLFLGGIHSDQLNSPTWCRLKNEKMKVAEEMKPPPLSHPSTSRAALQRKRTAGPRDGLKRGRTNRRVRQRALSQWGGQGEQKVAEPPVAASLSLCKHRRQQTPPPQPAGPPAALATRPRRKGNELQNMPFIFQTE